MNSSDVPLSDLREGVSVALVFINFAHAVGMKRRFVGRVGVCLHSLLPRCVHAVTLDGFVLKRMCFVYAHNFNLLHKVTSWVILRFCFIITSTDRRQHSVNRAEFFVKCAVEGGQHERSEQVRQAR